MLDIIKKMNVLKDNWTFFKLLKVSLERDLTEKEQNKFLESSYRNIEYLEEEFYAYKKSIVGNFILYLCLIDYATILIGDLKEGLNITKDNFIKENIFEFSAHYQAIKEFEDAFLEYRKNHSNTNFNEVIDKYKDAEEYSEGYILKKTLTKC